MSSPAYTPTKFVSEDGTQSATASTWREHYQLLWDGWIPGASPPERPAFNDRQLEYLEEDFKSGLSATIATEGGVLFAPLLQGIAADGATDDAPTINAIAPDSGRRRLPGGAVLVKRPLRIPKNTTLAGFIATTAANGSGTSIPNGIVFDSTAIMAGGNTATVAANGATWTFTVPSGHGLSAGDTFTGYGFANAGFNKACLIDSVTATTLVCAEATVPAASDTGSVAVHLIRIGSDVTKPQSASMLEEAWVECRDIPGSIGVYSSNIQEAAGLGKVNVVRARYRGVLIDGTNPFGTGATPLNYFLDTIRTVGSDLAGSDYRGIQVKGGNLSLRGGAGLTCTGGGTGANLPVAQIQLDGCRTGLFTGIHTENAIDGVLVGPDVACIGTKLAAVTGHSTITNAVVRIATAASGTNQMLDIGAVMPNGAAKGIEDTPNAVSLTGHVGSYVTDLNGRLKSTNGVEGVYTSGINADKTILATNTAIIDALTLPVGRFVVIASVTVIPGSGATQIELFNGVGGATATFAGQRAVSVPINGTQPVTVTMCFVATVTTAGSLVVRGTSQGANSTAKQNSPGGNGVATSAVAFKAP